MSKNSDNNDKPRTNIFELLPEVYRSDLNETVFETAFNPHLTKDDTVRVSGFVGLRNAQALVDRRIQETTPFRQAFQLQPTMYTRIGSVDHVLTHQGFLKQLELIGVDINRLPQWGNTLQFNWVPPINIDMLVNFTDYYWSSNSPNDLPQYLTIENRCNKALSKVRAYENIIAQNGALQPLLRMDVKLKQFVITGDMATVFTEGFVFFTKNTVDVNLANTFWTTASSTYDADDDELTITVQEDIAFVSDTTPPAIQEVVGRIWFKEDTDELFRWDGVSWVLTLPVSIFATGDISLTELLDIFQRDANCVCKQDYGWDVGLWDDNQLGGVLWNTALLTAISHPTEAAWVLANGAPADLDLWYDTTTNELKQYFSAVWNVVVGNFSAVLILTTGLSLWDLNAECTAQELNQWSAQNKWIHKTEVQSFGGVKRAAIPILEYNSTIELNEWAHVNYVWKYRALETDTFESTDQEPTRFELEPVKGYAAVFDAGTWYVYLFEKEDATLNRDINHTQTFISGMSFSIVNDAVLSDVYVVEKSEYRKIDAGDPVNAVLAGVALPPITDYYVTVVELAPGTLFTAPTVGGGGTNVRIEPTATNQGDVWRGYHVHWLLDANATTLSPTQAQPFNPVLEASLAASEAGTTSTYAVTAPDVGFLEVGDMLLVFTPSAAGVTTIELDLTVYTPAPSEPNLIFEAMTSPFYATPNSNELRVYVNDIRQYGTYTENVALGTPNYTAIGTSTTALAEIPYVESITFNEPLEQFDVVRVEVGPAALHDVGMFAVPVRTVEDEAEFTAAVLAGTQPVYQSLSQFQHVEQTKYETNQYPQFNVYDVCEAIVVNSSPLFAYKEDSSQPVNPHIRRRIVATTDGRDYTFLQYLLDRDDNILYGFRNVNLAPISGTYWYSPFLGVVYQWTGEAWTNTVFVDVAGVSDEVARTFTVSDTEPTQLLDVEGAFWLDSVEQKLYQRDTSVPEWVELLNIVVSDADPTLETVWNNGDNHEYVPQYVDVNREPVAVGDPNGDWELLDQWFYNSEHKNKAEATFSQLVTHFRSIVSEQPQVSGFSQGGIYTLTQNEYNYGLGGTIKEHNDSFDTLISAINVTNTTPVSLMEWAEDQYGLGVQLARDFFNTDITTLYGSFSADSLTDQTQFFADNVLEQYQQNDFLSAVYGDTSAYNAETDVGMPNWISTAPILRLSEKFRPHIVETDDFVELFHHDGHRSRIVYTQGEQDRYSRQIIALPDTRVAGGTLGVQDSVIQPQTESDFLTAFGGGEVRPGVYWYRVGGGFRTLYRFIAYQASTFNPPLTLPEGTRYYNISTNLTNILTGGVWVPETAVAFDISTLWQEVSFASDFAHVLLEIENRLYDAVPTTDVVFDYASLTPTASEQDEYDEQYEARFFAFVAERSIQAPLVNTTYSAADAFTWNYVNSTVVTPPRVDIIPDQAAAWQEVYTRWYGTPYPHLEPWKLQGYHDKPTWWDATYLETDGSRRWIYDHGTTTGMWDNIRQGIVPLGEELPDGSISTGAVGETTEYTYFSVNIDDVAVGGFDPDEVFPPYLSATTVGFSASVRSLFSVLTEVSAPDADYVFGDVGPVEWQWTVSSEYVYDIPIIAFLMQPARFLHFAFGVNFIDVNSLQVETTFCQVYSHEDALFHGDLYNTDQTYTARGLNQWYVNFNRSSGYDTSSEFRHLWAGWNPRQSYHFGGIIDTSSLSIASKFFDVVGEDYNAILANTGVFRDMWAEGFEVSVLNIPPAIVQYNNQSLWRFDLDTLAAVDRELNYYGVRLYPYAYDTTANEGTFFRYAVAAASNVSDRFYVSGNQTEVFVNGVEFEVTGSFANDGTYTTISSVFEPGANRTRINVAETVISSVGNGQIDITSFISPWQTGQQIVVSSTRNLPAPLVNGVPYFIIRTGNRTFQLAETVNDALNNVPIIITTPGDGVQRAGEIASSFIVFGGAGNSREIWYHYAIDKDKVFSVTPPTTVQGMQSLVNVFDGYTEYQRDQGQIFNLATTTETDPDTGRAVGWQVEIERFINWAYGLRRSRLQIADRFDFELNVAPPTTELKFTDALPAWQSGTPIVFSTTGSLPAPLIAGAVYYFVDTGISGVFKVSITRNTANAANHLTVTTAGSGTQSVAQHLAQTAFPHFEINPMRNNIWYDTPQGLMANVVTGPFADIRVSQTIFDQYGRQLSPDKLNLYRLDKLTRIAIRPELDNNLSMIPAPLRTEYDFLHLGGGHFFMEGYEHIVLFNDYAIGGALIYDQFYGLFTERFNMDYFEKETDTLRPTLGGYYLIDGQFQRNIEGSTVDLHNYYDSSDLREGTLQSQYARRLLGYRGTQSFLDLVNLNDTSQFLFHKAMIQYKGSVAGAKAYINSRRFIDAKIDEFWAWKIAEFGDPRLRVYPQIKLFADDASSQDVRLHFLAPSEFATDPDVLDAIDNDFEAVDFNVADRWEIYPEQKADIMSPLFLNAEVSSTYRVYVSITVPVAGQATIDYWFDPIALEFRTWNGGTAGTIADWDLATDVPIAINIDGTTSYVRLDRVFDDARVIRRKLTSSGDLREYETVIYEQGGGLEEFEKVNAEAIKFQTAGFEDVMIFFTLNPGFTKINPSKLIDTKAKTVIDDVQLWDPARGHHSTVAIHNVDMQNAVDPAGYSVTKNPDSAANFVWGEKQVGEVWLNTTELGYKAYYDDKLYPSVNDRLNLWGTLADWSSVRAYRWTSSPVPPAEYAGLVESEADNLEPQRSKPSGIARQTLFRRDRTPEDASVEGITSGSQTVLFTAPIAGGDPTGLTDGTTGHQDIDFTTTFVGADLTGLVGIGPFQANIFVDGESYLISVSAASASTYTDLITQIEAQLLGSATVTIFDTDTIHVESNSVGLGSTVIIQDINLFSNLADAPAIIQLAVDGTSTTYTATFTLDEVDYEIAVLGDDAQTFAELVDAINPQISGVGSIAIVGGNLVVSSTSVGTVSTVSITDVDLFVSLTDFDTIDTAVIGTYGKVIVPAGTFDVESTLLFTSTDTLPAGLVAGTQYTVTAVDDVTYAPDRALTLVDEDSAAVLITSEGTPTTFSAVPTFTDNWTRVPLIRERQYGCIELTPGDVEPTITLTTSIGWATGDKVDVYRNDIFVDEYELTSALTIDLTGTGITIDEKDVIDIVRPHRELTEEETAFDPDTEDDGTMFTQWLYDYEYSVFTSYTGVASTQETQTYYFWVENSQVRDDTQQAGISVFEVAQQLENIPTPYFVVQLPKDDPFLQTKYGYGMLPYGTVWSLVSLAEQFFVIPAFYRQAILRKASSKIAQDDRFVWKFTRNLALRSTFQTSLNLKNKHEEWFMFRREQPSNLPRELWDRLTEALIEYTLADSTVRVPSLDRELYDAIHGTDTRFGLGVDQAFCDKTFALASVLAYLTNPDTDFQPVDIDAFFATHSFDTPEDIEEAMNTIYNTFGAVHVNNIWFETLSDAFATRAKYKELMKTSWIALHGIRVLEVGGLFDD